MASLHQKKLPLLIGQVSHITDPSDFWMQIGDEAGLASLEAMEQSLAMLAQRLPLADVNTVENGAMVLVRSSTKYPGSRSQTQWRRAEISRVDRQGNRFDVFYFDHGSREIVPGRRVHGGLPDDVRNIARICCRCALAGIQPIARSWTTRGTKTFEKLVFQGSFKVSILHYVQDTCIFRVNLYPVVEGSSSRSLAHKMLEAETGLPTEENVQEYLKDVILLSLDEVYDVEAGYEPAGEEDMGPAAEDPADSSSWGDTWSESSPTTFLHDHPEGTSRDSTCTPQTMLSDTEQREMGPPFQNGGSETPPTVSGGAAVTELEPGPGGQAGPAAEGVPGAVVVPGFNLRGLQQRGMLSAEELQRETETVQKAMRRARLQKDMIECHRSLETMQMVAPGQGQKWGNSDLLFLYGRQVTQGASEAGSRKETTEDAEDRDHSGEDFEVTAQMSIMSLYPEDKGLKPHQDYIPDHFSELATKFPAEEAVADVADPEEANEELTPCDAASAVEESSAGKDAAEYNEEYPEAEGRSPLGSEDMLSGAQQSWSLPPPPEPHPSWSAEEAEYRTQDYIRQLLKEVQMAGSEGVLRIHKDVLCSHLHCMAPLDAEHCEVQMRMVLYVLLEEAVKNEPVKELALELFASYAGVLRGDLLLDLMRLTADKFVKLPVGRMAAYYTDFVDVLIRLLYQALDWPVLLKIVLQDFALNCLEKWIIFNKKGLQSGLLHHQVETVYVSCAELLLPTAIFMQLGGNGLERFHFILDQMREKVLETDVDYSIRSRLLTLLLKFPQPDARTLATEGSTALPADVSAADLRALPMSRRLRPLAPPPPPHPNSGGGGGGGSPGGGVPGQTTTSERGCQTEGWQQSGGGGDRGKAHHHYASAQAEEVAGEVPPLARKGSINGSADSVFSGGLESLDSLASAPGRARRRRALLDHLSRQQKQEGAGEGSAPDTDSATSSFSASLTCDPPPAASEDWAAAAAAAALGTHMTVGSSSPVERVGIPAAREPGDAPQTTGHTSQSDPCLGDEGEGDHSQLSSQATLSGPGAGLVRNAQELSPATAFVSAMSRVSRAAYSTVFGGEEEEEEEEEDGGGSGSEHAAGLVRGEDGDQGRISSSSGLDAVTREDGPPSRGDGSACVAGDSDMHAAGATQYHADGKGSCDMDADLEKNLSYENRSYAFNVSDCSSDSDSCDDWTDQRYAGASGYQNVPLAGSPAADEDLLREGQAQRNDEEEDVSQPDCREDQGPPLYSKMVKAGGGKQMFRQEDFPPLPAQSMRPADDSSTGNPLSLDSIAVSLLDSQQTNPADNQATADVGHNQSPVIKEEESGSVPSRWEDPFLYDGVASQHPADAGASGNERFAGHEGQGDWFGGTNAATSKQRGIDPAGDGSLSQVPHFLSPSLRVSQTPPSPGMARGGDVGDMGTLSPAGGESGPSQSSALSPRQGGSPGSAVPYKRGDLASMFDGGSSAKVKPRKKKFKPFEYVEQHPTVKQQSSNGGGGCFLAEYYCLNCGQAGHMRTECPKPRHSPFY